MAATGKVCGFAIALFVLLAAGCKRTADLQEQGEKTMNFTLTSSAFADGQPIPKKYTDDGTDVSPPLSWSNVPEGARQFALIVDDPDAPTREPWVHWVLYGISGDATSLSEGTGGKGKQASGLLEGENSWRKTGWGGPAPPSGVHHYHFKLYALDAELKLQRGLTKDALLKAIKPHLLGEAELVGTYKR